MRLETRRAGQDQRLPLPRAARADDGRHELVSIMQSVTLADRLRAGGRRGRRRRGRLPRRRRRQPRGRARSPRFRAATGWDGPPRAHHDRQAHPGRRRAWPAARPTPPPRCGCSRARPGIEDRDLLHEIATGLGADVPRQVKPGRVLATGAGEHRARARRPRYGVLVVPAARRALDRRRLPRGRPPRPAPRRATGSPPSGQVPGAATTSPLLPDALCSTSWSPPRSRCARALGETLDAVREAGADVAMVSGRGPTVLGCSPSTTGRRTRRPRPRRCRAPPGAERRQARRPRARGAAAGLMHPSAAVRLARGLPRHPAPRKLEPTLLIGGAIAVSALLATARRGRAARLQEDRRGRRQHARQVDLPRRRRDGVLRDRRVRRPDRSRRDVLDLRRRRGRPGDDLARRADRDRLDLRGRSATSRASRRAPARPRVPGQARLEGADHRGARCTGRGLLRPPWRQGDLPRPLRRAGPRGQPVPGRLVGDAARASCPTTSSARASGRRCAGPRLHLLAELRPPSCTRAGPLALGATSSWSPASVWLVRFLRCAEQRARTPRGSTCSSRQPLLRPSRRRCGRWRASCARGRVAAGPARFFWNRITPGELGLELTTLLAIAAVGSFAFVAHAILLDEDARSPATARVHMADADPGRSRSTLAEVSPRSARCPRCVVAAVA